MKRCRSMLKMCRNRRLLIDRRGECVECRFRMPHQRVFRYAASSECRVCQGNLLLDTVNIDVADLDSVSVCTDADGLQSSSMCVLFNIQSQ